MVYEKVMELAKECREQGLNFFIAIEDGEIQIQHSINGGSPLHELVKLLKTIEK